MKETKNRKGNHVGDVCSKIVVDDISKALVKAIALVHVTIDNVFDPGASSCAVDFEEHTYNDHKDLALGDGLHPVQKIQ